MGGLVFHNYHEINTAFAARARSANTTAPPQRSFQKVAFSVRGAAQRRRLIRQNSRAANLSGSLLKQQISWRFLHFLLYFPQGWQINWKIWVNVDN